MPQDRSAYTWVQQGVLLVLCFPYCFGVLQLESRGSTELSTLQSVYGLSGVCAGFYETRCPAIIPAELLRPMSARLIPSPLLN